MPCPGRRVRNPNGAPALRPSCRARPPRIHPTTQGWSAPGSSHGAALGSPRPDVSRCRTWIAASGRLAVPRLGNRVRTVSRRRARVARPRCHPKINHRNETKNRNSARIATFLRLRIVIGSPNRESRCKNAGNRPFGSLFPLWRNRKESAIAKKLQKWRDFCFSTNRLPQWGRSRKRRINPTGRIPWKTCGFSVTTLGRIPLKAREPSATPAERTP